MFTDRVRFARIRLIGALAIVFLATLALPGCLRVVRQQAPYYLKGPHQVEPPDGFLEPGTHVLTFGSKDTYSHVLTFDGIAADVWDGDLATLGEWRKQQQARKSADSGAGAPASAAPR